MAFDWTRFPTAQALAECFPGIDTSGTRLAVSCPIPGCKHKNGDRNPSFVVYTARGNWSCKVSGNSGRIKELILMTLGEPRWKQLCRPCIVEEVPEQRWAQLGPEHVWTKRYQIASDLARKHLRSGKRYPSDPYSDTAVGLWVGEKLMGAKFRLPDGARWHRQPFEAKYKAWKGGKLNHVILGLDRMRPGATVVACAGEKDWLVASSHLDPGVWAPVTGCSGEGDVPAGLAKALVGRNVVVAYDGDEAGHKGAGKVVAALEGRARLVRVALLADGEDLADIWERDGADALLDVLRNAGHCPDEWLPAQKSPVQHLGPELGGNGAPSIAEDPLDRWRVLGGLLCEDTDNGPIVRMCAVPKLASVEVRLSEDGAGGWDDTHSLVYEFELKKGAKVVRKTQAGAVAFHDLLDLPRLAAVNRCFAAVNKSRMHAWVSRESNPKTTTTRLAYGPHGDLGWLCAPHWTIKGGKLQRTAEQIEPPSVGEDLQRFRFVDRDDARLREVGNWVLDVLLRCDHNHGAYTVPLLGAFMCPPLWEYVADLRNWQRYTFFLQGESGIGKTVLTRYFWSFWGDFVNGNGLANWISTPTSIGVLMHQVVGAPLFVSDWKLSNFSKRDKDAVMKIMQAYGDRSSRNRCTVGAEMKQQKPPRCQLIVDGEDQPTGEQSTLGRMVIMEALAHEHGRCATAHPGVLAPAMVEDLPALTARWIGWVQTNAVAAGGILRASEQRMLNELPDGGANRTRLARNYAVQLASVTCFAQFLASMRVGTEGLARKAWEVHVPMAIKQLGTTRAESAGEMFLGYLAAVLGSGEVFLERARGVSVNFDQPFAGKLANARNVGKFTSEYAVISPMSVVPYVQKHATLGGGDRINFSRKAISQQLRSSGAMVVTRPRWMGKRDAWKIPLGLLGFDSEGR